MKKINYTISGIKYLLFEYPNTNENSGKLEINMYKYKGIFLGESKINQGFFIKTFVMCSILIPEENAFEFWKSMESFKK